MILLDTHILIWDALTPEKIRGEINRAIQSADEQNQLLIADISLWEISMLIDKKRLSISSETNAFIAALIKMRNFQIVPIDAEIAAKSVELAKVIMSDPADSLIAATSHVTNATLITADCKILDSNAVKTMWK